jgi:hypothetical protein
LTIFAAITYRYLAGEIPSYDNEESVFYGQHKSRHEYIFSKIYEPLKNSRHKKGDMKQGPY